MSLASYAHRKPIVFARSYASSIRKYLECVLSGSATLVMKYQLAIWPISDSASRL